jgi:bacillithiol system protein YtxJ
MPYLNHLHTPTAFDQLRSGDDRFMIFKYNPDCKISTEIAALIHQLIADHHLQEIYQVDVIGDTSLSQYIADQTSITHESPQCLIIHHQQLTAHSSHRAITDSRLSHHLSISTVNL